MSSQMTVIIAGIVLVVAIVVALVIMRRGDLRPCAAVFDPDGSGCHSVFDVRRRAAVRLWILRTWRTPDGHAL